MHGAGWGGLCTGSCVVSFPDYHRRVWGHGNIGEEDVWAGRNCRIGIGAATMDFDDSLFGEGSEDRGSDSSVVLEDAGKDTKKSYVARVCDHEVQ